MVFIYLFCIGLVALAMGILHPLGHFAAPAFSPVFAECCHDDLRPWTSCFFSSPYLQPGVWSGDRWFLSTALASARAGAVADSPRPPVTPRPPSTAARGGVARADGVWFRGVSMEIVPWSTWMASFCWSLCGAVAMAIPVLWISRQIDWFDLHVSLTLRVSTLTLSVAIGVVSYGLIVWGGRKSAFFMLSTRLPERLLRLLPQCLQTRR
jgi:hypothetical protein